MLSKVISGTRPFLVRLKVSAASSSAEEEDREERGTDYAPSRAFPQRPQLERGEENRYAPAHIPGARHDEDAGPHPRHAEPDSEFVVLAGEVARRMEPILPHALKVEILKLMRNIVGRE